MSGIELIADTPKVLGDASVVLQDPASTWITINLLSSTWILHQFYA